VKVAGGSQQTEGSTSPQPKPLGLYDIRHAQGGIDMSRVKAMLPVFGGLLYILLSVLFGSMWYAALSMMMARIAG
jgi:hypothetical protein